MKRFLALLALFLFLTTALSFSADTTQTTERPDPYKAVLDRLESFTVVPVPDWRFHADVPHPEDPSLDHSLWEVIKLDEKWSTGPRVLRRAIEIPEKAERLFASGRECETRPGLRQRRPARDQRVLERIAGLSRQRYLRAADSAHSKCATGSEILGCSSAGRAAR